jgi:hypothetical protein
MNSNVTIVTGLWDLGRGNLDGWGKRDFSNYKTKFFEMLETNAQMCIWIPQELEEEVLEEEVNEEVLEEDRINSDEFVKLDNTHCIDF